MQASEIKIMPPVFLYFHAITVVMKITAEGIKRISKGTKTWVKVFPPAKTSSAKRIKNKPSRIASVLEV